MSAAITDKLRKSKTLTSTTLGAGGLAQGGTTCTFTSTTNWPTDTAVTVIIDRVDSSGNLTLTKVEEIKGILSGTTFSSLQRGENNTTDQAHAAGAVVELSFTGGMLNDMVDWALVAHNQDGTHQAFTETSIVPTAAIEDSAVTTAKVADDAITQAKMADASVGTAELVDSNVTTAKLAANAATNYIGVYNWDTNSGTTQQIGGGSGGSGQWPGATGVNFTTTGGDLLIFGQMSGLSQPSGTGYIGVVIDGTGYPFGCQSNAQNVVFSLAGMTVVRGLSAGTHNIAPYGRSQNSTLYWNSFNGATFSIVELKR